MAHNPDNPLPRAPQYTQQNGNWGLKAVVGAMTTIVVALVIALFNMASSVSAESRIAIEVAKQHGEELLSIRTEISLLRGAMSEATKDRYKAAEAQRDLSHIDKQIGKLDRSMDQLMSQFREHEKGHNGKYN